MHPHGPIHFAASHIGPIRILESQFFDDQVDMSRIRFVLDSGIGRSDSRLSWPSCHEGLTGLTVTFARNLDYVPIWALPSLARHCMKSFGQYSIMLCARAGSNTEFLYIGFRFLHTESITEKGHTKTRATLECRLVIVVMVVVVVFVVVGLLFVVVVVVVCCCCWVLLLLLCCCCCCCGGGCCGGCCGAGGCCFSWLFVVLDACLDVRCVCPQRHGDATVTETN